MMKSKDKAVTGLTKGIAGLFKKNKVTHAPGVGSIKSANEVEVTAADGSVSTIKTKNILIATGSDIVSLPFLKVITTPPPPPGQA
jgi:dihydrolipoamide dehydrogenase